MVRPLELVPDRGVHLHDDVTGRSHDVWTILMAAHRGDVTQVRELVEGCPRLGTCMYDYTTPMQFAVQNGHIEVVKYLIDQGALDTQGTNHPFMEPLTLLAQDRGHIEICALLEDALAKGMGTHWGDTGGIIDALSEDAMLLQEAVDRGDLEGVTRMLDADPTLVENKDLFWGEGVLMSPASTGNREMIELLMSRSAKVPSYSKWGARYYFKHLEIGRWLLELGMDPNHSNWRGFTLLHDMGHKGFAEKAKVLIEFGADINVVDDEYLSTPLGYAVKWGHVQVVDLLLASGADIDLAGSAETTPLSWARKKGRGELEGLLVSAGASR